MFRRLYFHAVILLSTCTLQCRFIYAVDLWDLNHFSSFSLRCSVVPHIPIRKVWIYRLLVVILFVCLYRCTVTDFYAVPIKFARRVGVGSACVDIQPSPKTDVLAFSFVISPLLSAYNLNVKCFGMTSSRHHRYIPSSRRQYSHYKPAWHYRFHLLTFSRLHSTPIISLRNNNNNNSNNLFLNFIVQCPWSGCFSWRCRSIILSYMIMMMMNNEHTTDTTDRQLVVELIGWWHWSVSRGWSRCSNTCRRPACCSCCEWPSERTAVRSAATSGETTGSRWPWRPEVHPGTTWSPA